MAETLGRSVGGLALDTCVVLFCIVLRIAIHALCMSCMMSISFESNSNRNGNNKAPSTSTDKEFTDVGDLARQLPHTAQASDVYVLLLEQVERIFPFLIHVSIFLLPRDFTTFSRSQAAGVQNGMKLPSSSFSQSVGGPSADSSVHQFVDKLLSFRFVNKLDWTNCCTFRLFKSRGAVAQETPLWQVSCTSAYHAAFVTSDMICTDDYDKHGPHFSDWRYINEELGGRSMVAIPMRYCKRVFAVFGMASSVKNAFQREDLAWLVVSVFAPYMHTLLHYSTRRTEMESIMNEIISPLATRISQCMVVEKERAVVEESESPSCGKEKVRKRLLGVQSSSGRFVERDLNVAPMSPHGCDGNGQSPLSVKIGTNTMAPETSRPALNFYPSYSKKATRFSFDHICSTDLDLNWFEFMLNLISLCVVFVSVSKASVPGIAFIAVVLCFCVSIFDTIFIALRPSLSDSGPVQGGGIVMYLSQLYRLVVIPVVNTWMSWKVLSNLEFEPNLVYIFVLGCLIALSILLGRQFPFLLHTPLQILSIVFAVFSTPTICHTLDPHPRYQILCLGIVSAVQMLMAYLLQTGMLHVMSEVKRGDAAVKSGTFLPHMQVKRLSY